MVEWSGGGGVGDDSLESNATDWIATFSRPIYAGRRGTGRE